MITGIIFPFHISNTAVKNKEQFVFQYIKIIFVQNQYHQSLWSRVGILPWEPAFFLKLFFQANWKFSYFNNSCSNAVICKVQKIVKNSNLFFLILSYNDWRNTYNHDYTIYNWEGMHFYKKKIVFFNLVDSP